jgi:predicted naringenin-chalcone synthase
MTHLPLAGLSTVVPPGYLTAEEYVDCFTRLCDATPHEKMMLSRVSRQSRIDQRHSVVVDRRQNGDPPDIPFYLPGGKRGEVPSTARRMEKYEEMAPFMAVKATGEALESAGVAAGSITHLVTVSCTGFFAPSFDRILFDTFDLEPSVQRTHVGFMGCHGAINGLRVAEAFASCRPDARVLMLCIEICSLHYQEGLERDHLVPNMLFADGASSLVLGGENFEPEREAVSIRLIGTGSHLIPDSSDVMTWRIADTGFRMTLDSGVAGIISETIGPVADRFLIQHGLGRDEIMGWLVHPGGPRILDATLEALKLPASAGESSNRVLAGYGNMSSPTILFILDDYLRHSPPAGPVLLVAFGPGLMVEMALIGVG